MSEFTVILNAEAGYSDKAFENTSVTLHNMNSVGSFIAPLSTVVGSEAKEVLGQYNPCNPETNQQVKLNMPRVEYWMKVGAKPSQTVASLIKKASAK